MSLVTSLYFYSSLYLPLLCCNGTVFISHALESDRGRINKAFGYFKKMTEETRSWPRAARRLWRCVYLESYSGGKGKEQRSSNRATDSLFLVLFAVGLYEAPSVLLENKEQQCEKILEPAGREAQKQQSHIIKKKIQS